jgi:serine/threonine-protein kinase
MRSTDSGLETGQVVAGRFRIEGVLGEGGMGTVYRARHLTLRRTYAIKVLKVPYDEDETFVERFRREAIAASQVVHPNVNYITDFGRLDDGPFYIVLEYLEGIGLDEVLDKSGAQPLTRSLPILIQLADALDYAASVGIVHRDIKPENIMLCEVRGRQDVVKLVDFGIAKILAPEFENKRITLSGQIFGTPEYISPEGAMDLPVDGRSDIYSLGAIAFELLTGDPPFTGEATEVLQMHVQKPPATPSSLMPRQPIPSTLDGILLKCLAKRPADRYQTAAALCRDLLALRGQLAGLASGLVTDTAAGRSGQGRVKTTGAWGAITPDREPMVLVCDEGLGQERSPATPPSEAPRPGVLASQSMDLRAELHHVLKELGFSLGESAIRSEELSSVLSELLQMEEEIQSLLGQIRLQEQNFERIRFEAGEQETSLRYATLDLKLLRSQKLKQLQMTPGAALEDEVRDLSFQIETLDGRLHDVLEDKRARTQQLQDEVQRYKSACAQREEEVARLYTELHLIVERVRPQARAEPLQQQYSRLDALSEQLQLARQSVQQIGRG